MVKLQAPAYNFTKTVYKSSQLFPSESNQISHKTFFKEQLKVSASDRLYFGLESTFSITDRAFEVLAFNWHREKLYIVDAS